MRSGRGARIRRTFVRCAAAVVSLTVVGGAYAAGFTGASRQVHRRPGYITGTARNECGRRLGSFTVNAYGFDGAPNEFPYGSPPLGSAHGRNGVYALRTRDNTTHKPVNALVDSIEGDSAVRYEGHVYDLPLYPTDGRATFKGHSGRGIIRNFVLKVSGVRPGQSQYKHDQTIPVGSPAQDAFYGTGMLMFLHLGDVTGETLTVRFTPITARLADGCKSGGFRRSLVLKQYQGDENFIFQNIPLGFYRLTATLRGTTTRTVRLALDGQNVTTTSVPFKPVPSSLFEDGSAGPSISASLTSSPYGS